MGVKLKRLTEKMVSGRNNLDIPERNQDRHGNVLGFFTFQYPCSSIEIPGIFNNWVSMDMQ